MMDSTFDIYKNQVERFFHGTSQTITISHFSTASPKIKSQATLSYYHHILQTLSIRLCKKLLATSSFVLVRHAQKEKR